MSAPAWYRHSRVSCVALLLVGLAVPPALAEPVTPTPTPSESSTVSPTPTPSESGEPTPTPSVTETESPDPNQPWDTTPVDPIRDAEYWLDDLGIREAWATTRGEGVTIAIIDTGVASYSPAFDGVVGAYDASGEGTDGRIPMGLIDPGHGSRVASLAAGHESASGTGMIGVAPAANLLSVSLSFDSAATVPFEQQVADAIVWAVDNGADIINLSFTINSPRWPASWDDAFLHAFENDVLVIVAAGNRGSGTTSVGAPATVPGVLTVAGVTRNGLPSERASTQGITIGLAAPSENLLGTEPDGTVVTWNGTSGAAPIVAGIAALVRSAYPDLDVNNVVNRLVATATPTAGITAPPDPHVGYGIINALAAVTADVAPVTHNPVSLISLERWIELYRGGDDINEVPIEQQPREVAPLPPADTPMAAGSVWVPSRDSVLHVSIPLVTLTTAGILIGLGVTAAARLIRPARKDSA